MKKILVVFMLALLTIAAIVSASSCTVTEKDDPSQSGEEALTATEGLEYLYHMDDGEYEVIGFGTADGGSAIVIPSTYGGKPVTRIGVNQISSLEGIFCTSITIPDSVTAISVRTLSCLNLESITVSEGNTKYHSINNCLIETESGKLILGCKNSIIPTDGSVTSIGNYAFRYCIGLTSIEIPNGITSIGEGAFSHCTELERITVEEGNTKYHSTNNCLIETESGKLISGCKNSIIPTDGSVTSIGYNAFYACNGLTSMTIPDTVTSIGDRAFIFCRELTRIVISDSVKSIGMDAFNNCSRLTDIYYTGTVQQWNDISKGSDWDRDSGEYTVHCDDGDIPKQ